jgi:septal ring factor EnvC (AmiA/AmiB activator)
MMRAPMSRMDVLTPSELKDLLDSSELSRIYNQEIDRQSAYEILSEKIRRAEEEEAIAKSKEDREKLEKDQRARQERSKRGSRSRKSTRMHPLEKVLTSPTVIRSVLGILNKMIK